MPCSDSNLQRNEEVRYIESPLTRIYAERGNLLARLLCNLLKSIEDDDHILYEKYLEEDRELAFWWRGHQKFDKEQYAGKV